MISSRLAPRLSAPRACSATSFGQSEATAAAITISSRVFRSRCGRSQMVPKQYSWMARACVGAIALSSSQVFKLTEAGYPTVEGENWQAVLVPAGTPGDIITLLNREIVKVITLPDMKERLAALGFEPRAGTSDDSAAQIKTEVATWATVIRQAGIKAE
jgi:hypothetical protein